MFLEVEWTGNVCPEWLRWGTWKLWTCWQGTLYWNAELPQKYCPPAPNFYRGGVSISAKFGYLRPLVSKKATFQIREKLLDGPGWVYDHTKFGIDRSSKLWELARTKSPVIKRTRTICSIINNSAADCWILLKFGTLVHYRFIFTKLGRTYRPIISFPGVLR